MEDDVSKSGNFSVVVSRESTLASRRLLVLVCDGARRSGPEEVECGIATDW